MTQSIDSARLTLILNELRLPAIKQDWAIFAERADKESWPAARFLTTLAEHEVAERDRRRLARHLIEAQLLPGKTLDSFDFNAVPMISKAHVLALCAGDSWIGKGANLLLIGGPGGGKTHLASAIGLALVENGFRVLFARTSDLVQRLQVARRELALEAAINRLDRFHLLILDDLAYVSKDQAETSVLFELISARYEHRSLPKTANQPFGAWGKVFPDPAMTLAAVDRLVHHATIFEINVDSYRRRAAPIAVDVYFEDRGVMNKAIDGGERHGGIRKNLAPGAEWLVGRYEHGPMLITGTDQFEEDGGLRLIFADVGEIVEDQQMKAVEPVDGGFEREFAASDLQSLNQIRGSGEQNAEAIFHQRQADRGREMRFSASGSTDQQQIGAFADPTVACAKRQDMRLRDHRHRVEVEAVEGFSWQQLRLDKMARETAAVAFGDLVLGERGQEAGGRPTFLVRPLSEDGPVLFDRGQAELVEDQCEPGTVDALGHDRSPSSSLSSSS